MPTYPNDISSIHSKYGTPETIGAIDLTQQIVAGTEIDSENVADAKASAQALCVLQTVGKHPFLTDEVVKGAELRAVAVENIHATLEYTATPADIVAILHGLRDDINGIRTEVNGIRTEVNGLSGLCAGINRLRTEVNRLRTEVNGLSGLPTEVNRLRADMNGLRTEVNTLRTDIQLGFVQSNNIKIKLETNQSPQESIHQFRKLYLGQVLTRPKG
ncbi:hypothetical protein JR316_0013430 [Psilocybe cubensis]|uniref:Uncharacterized protein n=2 Tax=Psilocybe cubensis TaxID=181762 RepID=A0ACB8GFG1_PSICU|nr:uncharacterized protein JR316_0013430 [Psilocybe cubensis]KAH9474267.1 hypothetical protein JR316_0013430 [Psilocybe cubensis]